jgi:methyl-accepting chemotaxis protein
LSNDDDWKEIKEMMKLFATSSLSLQQHVNSLQRKANNIENQVGQMASSIKRLEAQMMNQSPSQIT